VDRRHAVSLGEGGTPLLSRNWQGTPVQFKLEFMMPTGSFKESRHDGNGELPEKPRH